MIWNVCPVSAIFILNRCRNPTSWSADARQYIFGKWRDTARRYGFREYDGPPLEPLELFTTKSGEEIVGQLYNFSDKGERAVALRPEMTPTLARMVARTNATTKSRSSGSPFRNSSATNANKKAGCANIFSSTRDIIGEADPAADAELIALLIDTLRVAGFDRRRFRHPPQQPQCVAGIFSQRCKDDSAGEYEFYQIIDKLERENPKKASEAGRHGFFAR